MWDFFANLKTAITAIIRMENTMGAIAKAIAGMSDKLDKIEREFDKAQEPDAEDRAALAAVQERLQRLDDKHADEPVDEPAPTPEQPADITPDPNPAGPASDPEATATQ